MTCSITAAPPRKLGKNVGDDFREGKITLPVVLAFRRGGDAEREFWRRTLERGETTEADLEHAIGLMAKHRALEDTIGRAHHYGAIARDALALFPEFADEIGAGRDGRFLHRADALADANGSRQSFGHDLFGNRSHFSGSCLDRHALPRRRFDPPAELSTQLVAAAASVAERNKPKQVAPEPDMRASRQPPSARNAASTSAMTGAARSPALPDRSTARPEAATARRRRSALPATPRHRARAAADDAGFHPAKTDLVGERHAGIDQHRRQRRQRERRAKAPRRCRA